MDYQINDYAIMKKAHPCPSKSYKWQIIRVGADIKIKCLGCGHIAMLSKRNFEKSLKKIEKE